QEVEAEKKLELPKHAAPVLVPAPAAVADIRESTGVRQGTLAGAKVASGSSSKTGLFIGLAAAVLIGVGVGAWYFLGRSGGSQQAAASDPAAATQPAALTPSSPVQPAPVPAGPTREELEAQIRTMLDAQSQQMEAKLKSQYEDRVKQLQQQLEETKRREEQARQAPAPAPADPEPAVQEPVKQADPTPAQSAPAPAPAVTTPPAATT